MSSKSLIVKGRVAVTTKDNAALGVTKNMHSVIASDGYVPTSAQWAASRTAGVHPNISHRSGRVSHRRWDFSLDWNWNSGRPGNRLHRDSGSFDCSLGRREWNCGTRRGRGGPMGRPSVGGPCW